MKSRNRSTILPALCLSALAIGAGGAQSIKILSENPAGGGGIGTNGKPKGEGRVTIVATLGQGISGAVSTPTAKGVVVRGNLIGQLYDVARIEVAADPGSIEEGGTSQLTATAHMDDGTTVALGGSHWTHADPVTDVSASGLATAGNVVEDKTANLLASWMGREESLALMVSNSGNDDFGLYAGDGIDDDWQVSYFGEDNEEAKPNKNPDGDRDNNAAEFLFGNSPLDPNDFFTFRVDRESANTALISPSRVIPNRTYLLLGGVDLANLQPIGLPFEFTEVRTDAQFPDNEAPEPKKFYQIQVTR